MNHRSLRALAGAVTAGALLVPASPASALLGLPLPEADQTLTQITDTVTGTLPVDGGIVTDTTGTVGGLLTDPVGTLTGTVGTVGTVVDGLVDGGATGGLLPAGTLDSLLITLGLTPTSGTGTTGTGTGTGTTTGTSTTTLIPGTGGYVVDARSPNAKFQVLATLRRIAKTGRIPLRITTDEGGIVAFGGTLKPGKKLKARKRARKAAAAKAIRFPAATLGFRKAGSLRVTIQLSRQAQRRLKNVRDARMTLSIVTADARRNQGKSTFRRTIKR